MSATSTMQNALFPDDDPAPQAAPAPAAGALLPRPNAKVRPHPPDEATLALARALPPGLRLGGSSWSYPGWAGKVWDREYDEARLARHGLAAYAQHPLFRTVCLDRAFYRALSTLQYAQLAAQVPDDFRFVVKAPLAVTDATVRAENGRAIQPNPLFLDPAMALAEFVRPALDGLGHKVGALVFQLSPLPLPWLADLPGVFERLDRLLRSMPSLAAQAPDGVLAVEVRDPEFLQPDFARLLKDAGAAYCLGLQAKMPPIAQQLPMLRAMWPGPLVCRWNLNPVNGAYGYENAEKRYAPFDKIVDPDPDTRDALAKVIAGTTAMGHSAFVTLSNQAEGCAPLTAESLALAVRERLA
jgi:uncharacterized protein YecE (DUF72 family)